MSRSKRCGIPAIERLRAVLREHYLTGIECDHEAKTDRASCACSRVRFPALPSVGASVESWIDHVVDVLGRSTPMPGVASLGEAHEVDRKLDGERDEVVGEPRVATAVVVEERSRGDARVAGGAREVEQDGVAVGHAGSIATDPTTRKRARTFIRAIDHGDIHREDRVTALVDLLGGETVERPPHIWGAENRRPTSIHEIGTPAAGKTESHAAEDRLAAELPKGSTPRRTCAATQTKDGLVYVCRAERGHAGCAQDFHSWQLTEAPKADKPTDPDRWMTLYRQCVDQLAAIAEMLGNGQGDPEVSMGIIRSLIERATAADGSGEAPNFDAVGVINDQLGVDAAITHKGDELKCWTPDCENGGRSKAYLGADDCRVLAKAFAVLAGQFTSQAPEKKT